MNSNWVVRVRYPNGEVQHIPAVSESHANDLARQIKKIHLGVNIHTQPLELDTVA